MSYLNLSVEGGVQYLSVDIVPEKVVNMIRLKFKDNQRFQNGFVLRPGYASFSAAVNASVRGTATTTDAATGYLVDGNKFYTVDTSGTRTERGTLSTSTGYVDIIIGVDNVFINETTTANGYTYVPSTTTFAAIVDPDFPDLLKATYQDTYFLGVERDSGRIWHSANDDASSWSATAFATAESQPDNNVSIISYDRNLYIFGEQTIEFWFNSGETFPFNRGDYTDLGCAATNSVAWLGGYVYFVGRNRKSVGQIYRINNQFIPQKVSTQPIDTKLESFSDISDIETIAFIHDGNEIVVFSSATNDLTLVYNATTDAWAQWEDSGETFPFNRGDYTDLGCAATNSVAWLGGYVYFVGRNRKSVGQIYRINNQFIPQKVSTQPIDTKLESFSDISDIETIAFIHDGNEIVVFSSATNDLTLVYNATTDAWAQWEDSGGNYYPFGHYMRLGNKHIIGASTAGALNQLNFTTADDAGTDFSWQLITPTLYSEGRYMAPDRIRIDLDDIAANGFDITLATSTDGGNTFATGRTRTVATGKGVTWNMPAVSDYLTYDLSGSSDATFRIFNMSTDIAIGGYR